MIASFILLSILQAGIPLPAYPDPAASCPRILLITGGHDYDTTQFYSMFNSIEGIHLDTISHPHVTGLLASEYIHAYDALVFYDYMPDMPEQDSSIYMNLARDGMPMLFMHHSICSFQRWDGFQQLVGGKYVMEGYGAAQSSLSGYQHDLNLDIRVAEGNHPVTEGIKDFNIRDEGYSNIEMTAGITPLLLTDSPGSSSPVAWIHQYDQSTVICLMLGHDAHAYENPSFQKLVSNSIFWLVGDHHQRTKQENPWPGIHSETRPWTRWWWLGSAVDKENISSQMEQYAKAGLGGVEITALYGVKGREKLYLDFLSPAWMDMLSTSISEAEHRGMGVDMNLGTGWPFGGPQITPEYAASRLIIRQYQISENVSPPGYILPAGSENRETKAILETLMAFSSDGTILDLTSCVEENGTLDWTPGTGDWELYAAFSDNTQQMVKRAAPGGEGFTMDHFSADALDVYLNRFEKAFVGRNSVRSLFNDSYEVYNASWSPGLFDEFLERRGYDLRNHLQDFSTVTNPEVTARLKSDYRLTLSELLLENFTMPWTAWSHEHGSITRNQAHGSPGNLVDLYAAVDIPEGEIYGPRKFDIPGIRISAEDAHIVNPNPMMLKLATSAAHVTNKPLISNETFTWLGEHFKVALSQCKPVVDEAFLSGINHVFYHGTTYSPKDAPWPGWLFYASVHFGPTNSFWPHLSGLNEYITRCQSILQSGKSDNEILVYWPIFDIWHHPEGLEKQLSVHNIQEWLHYPGIEKMADQGYSYDFISDVLLQQVESTKGVLKSAAGQVNYHVLVIPACKFMPVTTLQKILKLAREGSIVVFEKLPEDVPGFYNLEERREALRKLVGELQFTDAGQGISECHTLRGTVIQCHDLARALRYAGLKGEKIEEYGLKYTRRSDSDGFYYFLANHSSGTIDTLVTLNTAASAVLLLDPMNGKYGEADHRSDGNQTGVRIQLQSGQSIFVRTLNHRRPMEKKWMYERDRMKSIELEGIWKLSFISGGPAIPDPRIIGELKPWTDLGDKVMQDFSGRAEYILQFQKPNIQADEFILHLGRVHESARVKLNGHDLGILWSIPFEVKVGKYLLEGENTLSVEVANLMSNRIRSMDKLGISWRNFHEINFVNIAYKPFDASEWETETSGLAGPVRLIPLIEN